MECKLYRKVYPYYFACSIYHMEEEQNNVKTFQYNAIQDNTNELSIKIHAANLNEQLFDTVTTLNITSFTMLIIAEG